MECGAEQDAVRLPGSRLMAILTGTDEYSAFDALRPSTRRPRPSAGVPSTPALLRLDGVSPRGGHPRSPRARPCRMLVIDHGPGAGDVRMCRVDTESGSTLAEVLTDAEATATGGLRDRIHHRGRPLPHASPRRPSEHAAWPAAHRVADLVFAGSRRPSPTRPGAGRGAKPGPEPKRRTGRAAGATARISVVPRGNGEAGCAGCWRCSSASAAAGRCSTVARASSRLAPASAARSPSTDGPARARLAAAGEAADHRGDPRRGLVASASPTRDSPGETRAQVATVALAAVATVAAPRRGPPPSACGSELDRLRPALRRRRRDAAPRRRRRRRQRAHPRPRGEPSATATGARRRDARRRTPLGADPSFHDFFYDRIGPRSGAPTVTVATVNGRFSAGGCQARVADRRHRSLLLSARSSASRPSRRRWARKHARPLPPATRPPAAAAAASSGPACAGSPPGPPPSCAVAAPKLGRAGTRGARRRRPGTGRRRAGGRLGDQVGTARSSATRPPSLSRWSLRPAPRARWLARAQGRTRGAVSPPMSTAPASPGGGVERGASIARARNPDGGFPSLPWLERPEHGTGRLGSGSPGGPQPAGGGPTPLAYLASRSPAATARIAYGPGASPTPVWTAQALLGHRTKSARRPRRNTLWGQLIRTGRTTYEASTLTEQLWGGETTKPSTTSRSPSRSGPRGPLARPAQGGRGTVNAELASSTPTLPPGSPRRALPRASTTTSSHSDVFQTGSGTSSNMNANPPLSPLAGDGAHPRPPRQHGPVLQRRLSLRLQRAHRRQQVAGDLASAARWTAEGKTSLEDCPMLTWSLGWAPSPARLASTSLAFMFEEVPEPVWKTSIGNWSSCSPAATASPAAAIRSARSESSRRARR